MVIHDKDHAIYHAKKDMCWNCTPGKVVLDFCKRVVVRGQLRMTTLHHEGACYLPQVWNNRFRWYLSQPPKVECDLPIEIYSKLRNGVHELSSRLYSSYEEAALDFRLATYRIPPKKTVFQFFGGA